MKVVDNGRGIPVGIDTKTGKSALEVVMTVLHAGGKFGDGGYKVSGGLHGVGVSVVNALSTRVEVEVHTDGFVWKQVYLRGVPETEVHKGGPAADTGTPRSSGPTSRSSRPRSTPSRPSPAGSRRWRSSTTA